MAEVLTRLAEHVTLNRGTLSEPHHGTRPMSSASSAWIVASA